MYYYYLVESFTGYSGKLLIAAHDQQSAKSRTTWLLLLQGKETETAFR